LSQWAEKNLRLSAEDSAEQGRYTCDRAPFQRGILDACCDPAFDDVVVMSSAQVGKTTIIKAVIGYYIEQDPATILCVQPTVEMAQTFSRDRLAPMCRDSPVLKDKIADPKSRVSGNTIMHKRFPGGHITMAGSNSPSSLASRPIRIVLLDEVSRYPESAGAEGDPVNLARKRATTYWNSKVVMTSTPTIKGLCRIEQAYEASDQRKFFVPCPHCDHSQVLTWESVKFDPAKPEEAAIGCAECGALWSEGERQRAVARGEWRPTAPQRGVAGFHISEIYSPWSTPAKMAQNFLDAKAGGTEQLKTWINTSLGETWEEQGESISPHVLMARREDYGCDIPEQIKAITLGADVQQDRIEAELVGWGEDQESWSLEYLILAGDPTQRDVWDDLAAVINARYAREDGRELSVALAAIDSGYLTKHVYQFVERMGSHVVPTKGVPGAGRQIVETSVARLKRLRKRKATGVKPELVGVDEAKILLYRRLMQATPGPGYCHFPEDRDEEYFAQLTAEKLVTRYRRGRPMLEWVQERPRNEALDCRVAAHAALLLWGPDKLRRPPAAKKPPPPQTRRAPPRPQRIIR
jgi:phage terminase large subunit GpA-like protein